MGQYDYILTNINDKVIAHNINIGEYNDDIGTDVCLIFCEEI